MSTTKKYWQSVQHLKSDEAFEKDAKNEFAEHLPVDKFLGNTKLDEASTSRRDFLKFLGFSVTAATLAACETPVNRAIPYVVKPEEITPGIANYYASTYFDGNEYASVVVKTREGRPIHIQGNKKSLVSGGGTSARVNSSVLSLYDSTRLKSPMIGGIASDWATVDADISKKLEGIAKRGGTIAILSNTIISPSTLAVIEDVKNKYEGRKNKVIAEGEGDTTGAGFVNHYMYDAVSYSGISKANEASFGKKVIPTYSFDKANVIVSIGADFLSNWISPIEYSSQYAKKRKPGKNMSKHYQFETGMSLTGSNADIRGAIKPSEYGAVVIELYNAVAKKVGGGSLKANAIADDNNIANKISKAAVDLVANKGKSVVVSDSNDKEIQTVVNSINYLLGNYEHTLSINNPSSYKQGDDAAVYGLVNEMKGGKVDALLILGTNPAYSMPAEWNFSEGVAKVKLVVSFADKMNETAKLCEYICPDSHALESWNDAQPIVGNYSLGQPTINAIYKSRQAQSSLLTWIGQDADYHNYIQKYWEKNIYPQQSSLLGFKSFWNETLHDGILVSANTQNSTPVEFNADLKAVASKIAKISASGTELFFYTKTGIGEGQQINNPWLQELSDPITKTTWDNYFSMNPADMDGYNTNIQQAEGAGVAKTTINGITLELPVLAVPGQRKGTIGVALGYGQITGTEGDRVIGGNVYPALTYTNGTLNYAVSGVTLEKVSEDYPLALTQSHHTMMGRKMINETDIHTYTSEDREAWNPILTVSDSYGKETPMSKLNLWRDQDIKKGHRWGLAIDLNTCTGCSACVTACNAENNVPVVGRDEVRRNREMHWMRIDRYFSSDNDPAPNGEDEGDRDYDKMENPADYPQVVYQPVMCQHCNHAPCETVCPVAATTHSNEGLNQMAYNRCVGTRYCANNCPYKVRRFNWFNYPTYKKFTGINPAQDELGRMVLNPDVVVRTRGVMEKCSMCVQRIQAGKLVAKKKGEPVVDGSMDTACSAACPTQAITFGDHNDPDSQVHKESSDERAYHLLEDVGTQPNIWYMTKVRNAEPRTFITGGEHHHEASAEKEHGNHATEEGHSEEHSNEEHNG